MRSPWELKVGLALGGGAARGTAHIGVIRALVREGVPIDVVTGTSMGAVIGGAFAALHDIAEVERRVRTFLGSEQFRKNRISFLKESKQRRGGLLYSVSSLVRRGIVYGTSTLRPSFMSAEEFARSMAAVLPDVRVEDLKLPFGAVCLDIEAGEEVVLCHGRLRRVVAASSAIPGILPPQKLNGRILVDGGWVDKVPVLPAFVLGADIVIAVDISADIEDTQDYSRGVGVMMRAAALKDAALVRFHCKVADVVIEPAVKQVHWADFSNSAFCIEQGDRAATTMVPRITEILRHERWRGVFREPLGKRLAESYLASEGMHLCIE